MQLLHILNAVAYVQLLLYVLYKNPRSHLNRVCALLCACFAIWGIGALFMNNPVATFDEAMLAIRIDCVGWIAFAPVFLWFILIFTGHEQILRRRLFYFILFLPAVVLMYKQNDYQIINGLVTMQYGKTYVYANTIWTYLFFTYLASCMLAALILCFRFSRKAKERIQKKQALILFVSVSAAFLLGFIDGVVLPELGIQHLPSLAHFYTLLWAIAAVYSIKRYALLSNILAASPEKIINTISDSLIVMSVNGTIVFTNPATDELLGYKNGELLGRSFDILISERGFSKEVFDKALKEHVFICRDTYYRKKNSEVVGVNVSISILKNPVNEIVGIVCVARNTSGT